ncbi:5-formyltetrahydrofolate cyclo-ligase [Bacillus sp. ISL-47]|uniref:5-formyltetrahydrofolate cyclo-ligase n=1 Tax=Bacillus sp. ISL-47 TaxID=2819130 RepID=UPI001BE52F25|nr:5-formyltetrahydrofolate cyclo-ligase [Bacillus sp. ISL-47]MBT2687131.1 5-formyltetrahydrofolate cyclo-ligase [Bacillus sp. ISL-47]MBT2710481.1 5-formyltetrahydrofolate cyclo-ligase [Pseudomonas sp. ISL-84]
METEKKFLRKEMLGRLKELNKPEHEQRSYEIACKLYQHPLWLQAKTIGITVSNQPEADTWQIIKQAWDEGKKVAVPKCIPKTKEMVFRRLECFTDLESVYYGLWEPIEAVTEEVPGGEIDTVIVPGLAYMKNGYRLGFGGGYYDRFLEGYKGNKVSLAFAFQVINSLPVEEHDRPVEMIITDEQVWKTSDA